MAHESPRLCPLSPYETELLACFRLLNDAKQGAVAMLIASLSEPPVRRPAVTTVKLSIVSKD
jgi:hypothetical protein